MTIKNTMRRLAAGTGALALAMAGAVAVGTAASAAPANIDADADGSLIIHKRVGDEGAAGDGTVLDPAPGDPLEGAEFTLWRLGLSDGDLCVPLDLSIFEGWESVPTGTAPSTTVGVETAGFCIAEEIGSQETGENGETTFGHLELGLYYVQETDAPANIVSRTAPFYVAIPMPLDNDWLYNVHVYPKNQELNAPEKTINDDSEQPGNGLVVGSVVEWTISQVVPALNDGEEYTSASIWDVLNAEELAYAETLSVTLNGDRLADTEDYTIDPDGVVWQLAEEGLAKLTAGDVLTVVFTTTVLKVTETGDISNPGSDGPGTPGYGSEFNGTRVPGGPTPYTYWGQLSIFKHDNSAEKTPLEDAEFKVFEADGGVCTVEVPASGEIATGLSNAEGVVIWDGVTPNDVLGLFVANSENGPISNPSKAYCVYETKVPAGYTAVPFDALQTVTPGSNNVLHLEIENAQKEGPDLPLTGAQGTIAMTIGGLVLVGAGAGVLVMSRNRRNESA